MGGLTNLRVHASPRPLPYYKGVWAMCVPAHGQEPLQASLMLKLPVDETDSPHCLPSPPLDLELGRLL